MSDVKKNDNKQGQENIREEDVINSKIENLKFLRIQGIEPYKYSYQRTSDIFSIRKKHENIGEAESGETEKIAGRIMTLRRHGKTCFGNLMDSSGKIQFYIRKDIIGEKEYQVFDKLDIGDIIGIEGNLFRTKTGELTVKVVKFEILTKSLLPLPEKFHGLKDKELRYRKRYLDLMVNEDVKKVFEVRTKIIKEIRNFLDKRGFIEVETPMLHPIPGGARARPFITHHNVLDMDLYLRIAPELYLKKLLVAGFEKVYEINRNFRNEGISIKHNPEFTMLELYAAYEDYSYVMQIMEDMVIYLADEILGKRIIEYQGEKIDLNPPWKRISMKDAIKEYASIDIDKTNDDEIIKLLSQKEAITIREGITRGELIAHVFEEFVESKLIQPIFITDFPVEVSPLSKVSRKDPSVTERFEPFIFGREIGNGFSELNDAVDQEQRFKKQIEMDTQGEVHRVIDYDFIDALKFGMPPAAGLGIGIDRLVMFFTNSASIRDVILFPLLRPDSR